MPDWTKIVRARLGKLPFEHGRPEEVIDELAQQLESAYEEAIAAGVGESEAMRRSLAQFRDWEKLRSELFLSVEGRQLPVWEQKGIFAPSRLPVWITLAVALVFLALPSFRKALEALPLERQVDAWDATAFPPKLSRAWSEQQTEKSTREPLPTSRYTIRTIIRRSSRPKRPSPSTRSSPGSAPT